MKSIVVGAALMAGLLSLPAAAHAQAPDRPKPSGEARGAGRDVFHFEDVTLTDGDQVYDGAEIYVRVRPSGQGYTRADYLDQNGRRLGFYEAFQVVSRDEAPLRAWAVRNFPDRTTGTR